MPRLLLLTLVVIASLWQAGGALLYMLSLGSSPAAPFVYGGVKVVMLVLPMGAIALGWRRGTFLKGVTLRDVVIGLALGAVFFVAIFSAFRLWPELFANAFESGLARAEAFGIATPVAFIIVGLLFALLHSLFEEYYWRWFVYGALRELIKSRIGAVFLAGAAFALHHIVILLAFTTPLLAILFGFLVGAVGSLWSFLYDRRGNIAAAWLSHLLADLAIVSAAFVILFGV